eukprot:4729461-Pyramimonas_sp.AAC.1
MVSFQRLRPKASGVCLQRLQSEVAPSASQAVRTGSGTRGAKVFASCSTISELLDRRGELRSGSA